MVFGGLVLFDDCASDLAAFVFDVRQKYRQIIRHADAIAAAVRTDDFENLITFKFLRSDIEIHRETVFVERC